LKASSPLTSLRQAGIAAALSLAVAAVGSLIWSALLVSNARTTPAVPWSVPAMALVLVVYWWYLSGHGWPSRTQPARAALLRARRVPIRVFGWSFLAGGFSLVALVGLWIVLVELTGNGGNPTISGIAGYPAIFVALAIAMGSLVSPLTEEAAFRGYAQVLLERRFSAVVAVVISSLFFAAWHGPTQGFFWSKLLFFFAVGLVFGSIAYLTNSTLPALPVHVVGDVLFFTLIWPHDFGRPLVWTHGADATFWLEAGQTVVFAALAIIALRRLRNVNRQALRPIAQPSWGASE
jgi:membrane protease YdiL (CAAX protease family)